MKWNGRPASDEQKRIIKKLAINANGFFVISGPGSCENIDTVFAFIMKWSLFFFLIFQLWSVSHPNIRVQRRQRGHRLTFICPHPLLSTHFASPWAFFRILVVQTFYPNLCHLLLFHFEGRSDGHHHLLYETPHSHLLIVCCSSLFFHF